MKVSWHNVTTLNETESVLPELTGRKWLSTWHHLPSSPQGHFAKNVKMGSLSWCLFTTFLKEDAGSIYWGQIRHYDNNLIIENQLAINQEFTQLKFQ